MKQTVAEFAASRKPSNKGRRTPASVAMQKKPLAGTPAMQKKAAEVFASRKIGTLPVVKGAGPTKKAVSDIRAMPTIPGGGPLGKALPKTQIGARRSSAPLPPRLKGMATAPKGNRRMQYNKGGSVGKLNTGIKSC